MFCSLYGMKNEPPCIRFSEELALFRVANTTKQLSNNMWPSNSEDYIKQAKKKHRNPVSRRHLQEEERKTANFIKEESWEVSYWVFIKFSENTVWPLSRFGAEIAQQRFDPSQVVLLYRYSCRGRGAMSPLRSRVRRVCFWKRDVQREKKNMLKRWLSKTMISETLVYLARGIGILIIRKFVSREFCYRNVD